MDNEGTYAPAFAQSRKRLQKLNPEQIATSSKAKFDGENNVFYFESFGRYFSISFPEGQVYYYSSNDQPEISYRLILLNYLSNSKNLPLTQNWVSYRELPQGNVFFPAIKTHVLDTLAKFYEGCDKNQLQNNLSKIGFSLATSKADLAAKAFFAPRIPVLIQFWEGDEDVPSSCRILFDSSIEYHLHIEDIAVLCSIIKNLVTGEYHHP